MEVAISPEMEKFVQDQVKSGHFASPTEVFEASLRQMMLDVEFDDEEEIKALEEAERQIAAGETFTLEEVRREFVGE
jgi:putative addiction module CopG family antidote